MAVPSQYLVLKLSNLYNESLKEKKNKDKINMNNELRLYAIFIQLLKK